MPRRSGPAGDGTDRADVGGSVASTMTATHRHYLFDLGLLLKERALEARRERDASAPGSADRTFQAGRLLAFNEVLSIMRDQAEAFGIPLTELRLDDLEPDRDLL